MNLEQIAERAGAIATELETLTAVPEWTDEQRAQFDTLSTGLGTLEARKADIEKRDAVLARARAFPAAVEPGRSSSPAYTTPSRVMSRPSQAITGSAARFATTPVTAAPAASTISPVARTLTV